MSTLTRADKEFKHALSRWMREYENEIIYLKDQLVKERDKSTKLEEIVARQKEERNEQV